MTVEMKPIVPAEREKFLGMAERHFRDLNPAFEPHQDWKSHYFEKIIENPRMFARWILKDGACAGFILFGIEEHRFLPRLTGIVYEVYVSPEFRRMGVARQSAAQAIRELQSHSPSKIQLEVTQDNFKAVEFWQSMGFRAVAQRYQLKERED